MSFTRQPVEITAPWLLRIVEFTDYYHVFDNEDDSPTIKNTVQMLLRCRSSMRHYCLECGQDMGPYGTTRQLCGKWFCENL